MHQPPYASETNYRLIDMFKKIAKGVHSSGNCFRNLDGHPSGPQE